MAGQASLGIIGATGLLGSDIVAVLGEAKLNLDLHLFASADSAGEVYEVGSNEVEVECLEEAALSGLDIVIFAASAELSSEYVPKALKAGCTVIDVTSAFAPSSAAAGEADAQSTVVPLVAACINPQQIQPNVKHYRCPNALSMMLAPVLKAIQQQAGLKRVVASSYQSVSSAGKAALDELWDQTRAVFMQRDIACEAFPQQIAFNCIPQIDLLQDDGSTKEENRVRAELSSLLGVALPMQLTCVRIPVLHAQGISLNVETERECSGDEFRDALQKVTGIELVFEGCEYSTPLQVAGSSALHVGRLRRDVSVPHGMALWVVADNLRYGVAANVCGIVQRLLQQ
jgi:aspartate-semialdehyde dehydrogenase